MQPDPDPKVGFGPMPVDGVEVGRIVGAWGLQGGLKVKPFSPDPQALFSSKRWYLQPSAAATSHRPAHLRAIGPGAAPPALLHVVSTREQGDHVVATAQEVPDRSAAEALVGARIFVSRASFPTPSDNEFYWVDLIGLQVHNRSGEVLGGVVGLLETGPHCVLRVRADGSAPNPKTPEILIPFVDAYVDRVDMPGRVVHVDWARDD